MSQEDVQALVSGYEALLRGDIDAALAFMDKDIEVYDHERSLDTPKTYRGPQGVLEMALEAADPFEDHRFEPRDFTPSGDQVLVAVRRKGRGRTSGVEVDEEQWHVWTFSDGTAVRLEVFVDEQSALEAAGLSE